MQTPNDHDSKPKSVGFGDNPGSEILHSPDETNLDSNVYESRIPDKATDTLSHILSRPSLIRGMSLPISGVIPVGSDYEDLLRFPNESLHSFSFSSPLSVQNPPFHANNGNARYGAFLKRSVDYLREQRHRKSFGSTSDSVHLMARQRELTDRTDSTLQTHSPSSTGPSLKVDLVSANSPDNHTPPLMTAPIMRSEVDPFDSRAYAINEAIQTKLVPESPTVPSIKEPQETASPAVAEDSLSPSSARQSSTNLTLPSSKYRSVSDSIRRPQLNSSKSWSDLAASKVEAVPQELSMQSPLLPMHLTNRWGRHTSEAVFTTEPQDPWRILSTNDYACLIFGLRGGDVRSKTILDFFTEASKARIRHLALSSNHELSGRDDIVFCGDVFKIKKKDTFGCGAASLWVKQKKGHIVWILEEIECSNATLELRGPTFQVHIRDGRPEEVFGFFSEATIRDVIPSIPLRSASDGTENLPEIDRDEVARVQWFNAYEVNRKIYRPCHVELNGDLLDVSLAPYIAGIIIVSGTDFTVTAANKSFLNALFGRQLADNQSIEDLLPGFRNMIDSMEELDLELQDGSMVTEEPFRQACTLSKTGSLPDDGLGLFQPLAIHRDGCVFAVDIQMRVFREKSYSGKTPITNKSKYAGKVLGLWISYGSALRPSPSPSVLSPKKEEEVTEEKVQDLSVSSETLDDEEPPEQPTTIDDLRVIEEMGSGAYGKVKLARYRRKPQRKVVVKYIDKSRILVDTWTRDRKLGTVPLEIHVLNNLREHLHRNVVDMISFFEDPENYYVLMAPHGPGMDLFDYIEVHNEMTEKECIAIFIQIARAMLHLHSLGIVHRDIKDENIVLDHSGWVKLIDFGSANYARKGPFDTFHGTLDYAAPEVLRGQMYAGMPQDVWALGILLYTIVYKENPFYNIDEIMDRDLRIPYVISPENIDLIKLMLDRDVEKRPQMESVITHGWLSPYQDVPSEELQIPLAVS